MQVSAFCVVYSLFCATSLLLLLILNIWHSIGTKLTLSAEWHSASSFHLARARIVTNHKHFIAFAFIFRSYNGVFPHSLLNISCHHSPANGSILPFYISQLSIGVREWFFSVCNPYRRQSNAKRKQWALSTLAQHKKRGEKLICFLH